MHIHIVGHTLSCLNLSAQALVKEISVDPGRVPCHTGTCLSLQEIAEGGDRDAAAAAPAAAAAAPRAGSEAESVGSGAALPPPPMPGSRVNVGSGTAARQQPASTSAAAGQGAAPLPAPVPASGLGLGSADPGVPAWGGRWGLDGPDARGPDPVGEPGSGVSAAPSQAHVGGPNRAEPAHGRPAALPGAGMAPIQAHGRSADQAPGGSAGRGNLPQGGPGGAPRPADEEAVVSPGTPGGAAGSRGSSCAPESPQASPFASTAVQVCAS